MDKFTNNALAKGYKLANGVREFYINNGNGSGQISINKGGGMLIECYRAVESKFVMSLISDFLIDLSVEERTELNIARLLDIKASDNVALNLICCKNGIRVFQMVAKGRPCQEMYVSGANRINKGLKGELSNILMLLDFYEEILEHDQADIDFTRVFSPLSPNDIIRLNKVPNVW